MHGRQGAWKGQQLLLRLSEKLTQWAAPFGPEEECAGGQLGEALKAVAVKEVSRV